MSKVMKTIGQTVGRNLQLMREERGDTQAELARQLTAVGSEMTKATIASLESGRRLDVTVGELVTLAQVLQVPLSAFFAGKGTVRPTVQTELRLPEMRALMSGEAPKQAKIHVPEGFDADQAAARSLGVDLDQVLQWAHLLWSKTMTDERDARVAKTLEPDASPRRKQAIRGHVTRGLMAELAKESGQ